FPNTSGKILKNLLRQSIFRAHLAGLSMVGEDMPQEANVVDLDPKVRDVHGLPVPRITYSAHRHELAASAFYGPKLQAICQAAPGAVASGTVPIGVLSRRRVASAARWRGPPRPAT